MPWRRIRTLRFGHKERGRVGGVRLWHARKNTETPSFVPKLFLGGRGWRFAMDPRTVGMVKQRASRGEVASLPPLSTSPVALTSPSIKAPSHYGREAAQVVLMAMR